MTDGNDPHCTFRLTHSLLGMNDTVSIIDVSNGRYLVLDYGTGYGPAVHSVYPPADGYTDDFRSRATFVMSSYNFRNSYTEWSGPHMLTGARGKWAGTSPMPCGCLYAV